MKIIINNYYDIVYGSLCFLRTGEDKNFYPPHLLYSNKETAAKIFAAWATSTVMSVSTCHKTSTEELVYKLWALYATAYPIEMAENKVFSRRMIDKPEMYLYKLMAGLKEIEKMEGKAYCTAVYEVLLGVSSEIKVDPRYFAYLGYVLACRMENIVPAYYDSSIDDFTTEC